MQLNYEKKLAAAATPHLDLDQIPGVGANRVKNVSTSVKYVSEFGLGG